MVNRHDRTVADLMSENPVVLRESDAIARALELMLQETVHHLPVVDAHGKFVGLVSDRDLLRALAASSGRTDPVASVMSRSIVSVEPKTHAHAAAEILLDAQINSLPVTAPDGQLVGMLTSRDFLGIAERALRGEDVASR